MDISRREGTHPGHTPRSARERAGFALTATFITTLLCTLGCDGHNIFDPTDWTFIVSGEVRDQSTGDAIPDAIVEITAPSALQKADTTDSLGRFKLVVAAAEAEDSLWMTLDVSREGFGQGSTTFEVSPGENVTHLIVELSPIDYDPGSLRDPDDPANTVSGLRFSYYHGIWDVLPDFDALTPLDTGTISNFDIGGQLQSDNFGFRFTGYVDVPTDGAYTFYTSSDDGSKLYIDTAQVVDNDGVHSMRELSGQIGLKAGKHSIRVEFFERTGLANLAVSYSGPGISRQSIPDSALYHVPAS